MKTRLLAIGALALAAGCAGMPQDGIVGMAYCGQTEPMTAGYCPCTHEMRVSAIGYTCVELGTEAEMDDDD